MNETRSPREVRADRMYIAVRIATVLLVAMLFFPAVNPARMITQVGQSKNISNTSSLFTCAISFKQLVNGYARAFSSNPPMMQESWFYQLYASCILMVLGIAVIAVSMCASLGNLSLKKFSNKLTMGGAALLLGGSIWLIIFANNLYNAVDPAKIGVEFPNLVFVYIVFAAIMLIMAVVIDLTLPKAGKHMAFEMETKYKLFLMFLPFLFLIFAFSYLPLYSWRYAFHDLKVGEAPTNENFVGFFWFTELVKTPAYARRLLLVLRNTLVMSGLGLLTSWVPMAFAIFLNECKSQRFKRIVQTFTTIPNFISWVLVYAIATAVFSREGFLNGFLNLFGGEHVTNYLASADFIWVKMLLWGMWKGVGWSAIIYISGIAGIDQQLYEAASIDGANRFARMRHVTLPGILPTFIVMFVMSIAGILSNGMDQYLIFANANNMDKLEVLDLYTYNLGLGEKSLPLATLVGMSKSIISVVLLFIANNLSRIIRGSSVV